jgi:hypothetical protein
MKSVESQLTFRTNMLPTSSGSKNKPRKILTCTKEPLFFNCLEKKIKFAEVHSIQFNMKHFCLQYFSKGLVLKDKHT